MQQGHLAWERIEEYCLNRLGGTERIGLEKHLDACEPCRKRTSNYGELVGCLKTALRKSVRVPEHAQQRFSAEQIIVARDRLPISRVVGVQALAALQKESSSLPDIEAIVSKDPVLSAHLVKVANSALLSFGHEARTVAQAIARVGFERTRLHIWGMSMKRLFSSPSLKEIWEHSVRAAQVTRRLAEMTRVVAPDEASLAALVHDIGQIVLSNLGESFERSSVALRRQGRYRIDIERQLCGSSHAEIGADLLEAWAFPEYMVEAVRYHHAPSKSSLALPALLYVTESWMENDEDVYDPREHSSALRHLGLKKTDLSALGSAHSSDLAMLSAAA